MTNKQLINALQIARKTSRADQADIDKSLKAIAVESPVKLIRARRSIRNALAHGGKDDLTPEEKSICQQIIDKISDIGGNLPQNQKAKSENLNFRIDDERKARYNLAAVVQKKTLTQWITDNLDKVV
jgi:HD-GYP domain-containing protein (c-di-GMP phosphodiesterase class II)